MQFKTTNSNLLNTQDKKISNKFYQHNACRDLEKEIHSLCWYNGINQIFTSTGQVMCLLCLKKSAAMRETTFSYTQYIRNTKIIPPPLLNFCFTPLWPWEICWDPYQTLATAGLLPLVDNSYAQVIVSVCDVPGCPRGYMASLRSGPSLLFWLYF